VTKSARNRVRQSIGGFHRAAEQLNLTQSSGNPPLLGGWRNYALLQCVGPERFLAKRMNATTVELEAGHLSLVSHPREIADLILAAAGRKN
jgi:hypothetical protein